MIAKIGILIFMVSLMFAGFTSNLFLSTKEKSLAEKFKRERRMGHVTDAEAKYAYMNLLITNFTRLLMVVGLFFAAVGSFFD